MLVLEDILRRLCNRHNMYVTMSVKNRYNIIYPTKITDLQRKRWILCGLELELT